MNTEVPGDPEAIAETARSLRATAHRVDGAASEFHTAAGRTEAPWTGPSADGFRRNATRASGRAEEIRGDLTTAQGALDDLADTLRRARSRMDDARAVARDGGLTVTATTIEPPGCALGVAPPGPIDGFAPAAEQAAHQQALDAWRAQQRQWDAYRRAQQIHDAARAAEEHGHDRLTGALEGLTSSSATVIKGLFGIGRGLAQSRWTEAAGKYSMIAENLRRPNTGYLAPRGLSPSTAGQLADELDARAGTLARGATVLRTVGRGMPVLSAGVGYWADTRKNMPKDKAAVKNVGAAVAGAAAAGAVATSWSGPGAIVGAAVAGGVAGVVVATGVDKYYDDVKHAVSENPATALGVLGGPGSAAVGAAIDHRHEITDAAGDGVRAVGDVVDGPAEAVAGEAKKIIPGL